MKNKKPFLSIVLPTYNRLSSIREIFLSSLKEQNYQNYELIIIDDDSSDRTKEYFNSLAFFEEFPSIAEVTKYFRNSKNLGAPASRNLGVKKTSWLWIWIVEDDIQFKDPDFLQKAIHIIEKKKKEDHLIKLISPYLKIMNDKGYYQLPKNQICKIWFISGEIYFDVNKKIDGYVDSTHCVTFIEKSTWNMLGGQDERLYIGNTFRDESDFYIRVIKNWFRIWYAGEVLQASHRNDLVKTWGQKKINTLPLSKQEFIIWENHYKFLKKNFSFPYVRIILFVTVRVIKHLFNSLRLGKLKYYLGILWL